ncbi:immune-induced peptide 18 [Drosophila elegans]|uniref:immune-induced peptide 18 n=1 Tax=Drosophila elegans TaxID=30023 RepID=UPI0007E70077|nr:immune-induced peptide 18 [Drosophila elegans]
MKLFVLCCLLILGLLGCLPAPAVAVPSRHSGPGNGAPAGNPFRPPQQKPLYYDAPVGPRSKTMYA